MIKGRSFSHLHSNLNIFLWKLKLLLSIFAYFRKWFVLHTNMPDTFVIFIKMYFLKLHNTLWSLLFILLILHIKKFLTCFWKFWHGSLVWLDHSIKNEGSVIHASIHIKYCSCVCGKLDFITSEWKQQYPVALSLLSGCNVLLVLLFLILLRTLARHIQRGMPLVIHSPTHQVVFTCPLQFVLNHQFVHEAGVG